MAQSDLIVEKGIFSVVVKDLSVNITDVEIREKFETYGTIEDVFLPLDGYTRKNRGFGFVRFSNKDDQEEAIRDIKKNGCRLGGRNIRAEFATSEPKLGGQHEARGGRGGDFVDRRVKSMNARDYHGDLFRRGRDDRNGYRPRDDDYQGAQRPKYDEEARGLYVRKDDRTSPRYETRERSPVGHGRAGYRDDPRDDPREASFRDEPRREEYRPRDDPPPPRREEYREERPRDGYARDPRDDYDRRGYAPRDDGYARREPEPRAREPIARHDDPRYDDRRRDDPRYDDRRAEPRYEERRERIPERDPYARNPEPRSRDPYEERRDDRREYREPERLRDAYDRDVKMEAPPRRADSRDRYDSRAYRDERYR